MKRLLDLARQAMQRVAPPPPPLAPLKEPVDLGAALASLVQLPPRELEALMRRVSVGRLEGMFDASERVLLDNPNWRRSPSRILRHFSRTAVNLEATDVVGRHVLDFGCGHSNPLAAALVFYLNGAAKVTSTDLKAAKDHVIAAGLYYLAKSCALHPADFAFWGTSPQLITERLAQLDMAALRKGDWKAALEGIPIRHRRATAEQYAKDIGPVDLVVSQSVLEHVTPFAPVMASLAGLLSPGGKMVQWVDFTDHDRKKHRKDRYATWRFLTTNDTRGATHSNRIRLSEMVSLIDQQGFRTTVVSCLRKSPPAGLRAKLIEPFSSLSDDDLAAISAMLVSVRVD